MRADDAAFDDVGFDTITVLSSFTFVMNKRLVRGSNAMPVGPLMPCADDAIVRSVTALADRVPLIPSTPLPDVVDDGGVVDGGVAGGCTGGVGGVTGGVTGVDVRSANTLSKISGASS